MSRLQEMSFDEYREWSKLMKWLVDESGLALEDVYQAARDAVAKKKAEDERREREQRLRDAQMRFTFEG